MSYKTAQYVFRPALTQFTISQGIGMGGPATIIAPLVSNGAINGQYRKYNDRVRLEGTNVKRAAGAKRAEQGKRFSQMVPFTLTDRSISIPVPIEDVSGQKPDALFDELVDASEDARQIISYTHEKDVFDLVWADSVGNFQAKYGGNAIELTTKFNQTGGNVKQAVRDAAVKVYRETGYYPTDVFFTDILWTKIISDTTTDLGKRYVNNTIELPNMAQVARYLGVERVHVMQNLADISGAGVKSSMDFMYDGDHMLLCKIDPSNRKNKMTFASTFYWDAPEAPFLGVFTKFDDDTDSYKVKAGAYYDVHPVNFKAAAVLLNCWDN